MERARRLRRRFRNAQRPRSIVAAARVLLVTYWLVCLSIIAVGLERLYPGVRPALLQSLRPSGEPAWISRESPSAIERPQAMAPLEATVPTRIPSHGFRSCAAAHQAGVYDIPRNSPAYDPRQDGDGDGLACEPY